MIFLYSQMNKTVDINNPTTNSKKAPDNVLMLKK